MWCYRPTRLSTALPLRLHHPSFVIKLPIRPLLFTTTHINNHNARYFHKQPPTMSTKQTPVEHVEKASGHSKACCSIPPILSEKEYKAKGAFETIDSIKTCSYSYLPPSIPSQLTPCRRHRLPRRHHRHLRRRRHLRILPPNPPRRRHPRLHLRLPRLRPRLLRQRPLPTRMVPSHLRHSRQARKLV